jgi:hypothetical protein
MTWIESEGGPLLLLAPSLLRYWDGIRPPPDGRLVEAKFRWDGPGSPATDYDRACDINDYLGLIAVGPGFGLVLGDGETSTTWWPPASSAEAGLLVNWIYANDEESVLRCLTDVPAELWGQPAVGFELEAGPLWLFDSACPGDYIDVHLEIPLASARYLVETAVWEPDQQASLVLHRFTAIAKMGSSQIGRQT